MTIEGIEGLSVAEINEELKRGAKFVVYTYCISLVILTLRRSSDVYFIRSGQNAVVKGLGWTLLSALLGWWGIPWGPIRTIGCFITNFKGGKNVTREILKVVNARALEEKETA